MRTQWNWRRDTDTRFPPHENWIGDARRKYAHPLDSTAISWLVDEHDANTFFLCSLAGLSKNRTASRETSLNGQRRASSMTIRSPGSSELGFRFGEQLC